jgi:dipicolinate synthase subunit A
MSNLSIAIVGGDLRYVRLCDILVNKGFDVWVYGITHPDLPKNVHKCSELEDIGQCAYVMAPIPFSQDNISVYTPLSNGHVSIERFMEVTSHAHIILGVLKPQIKTLFEQHHLAYTDLMQMDEVAVLNAVPTAEGAIQYAMQNSEITLHGSNCIVLGFGRCGKILAHKLKGLGANVAVEARSTTDLAFIETYGYQAIPLAKLKEHIGQFDFIFNTIPVVILQSTTIDLLKPHAVYIELASAPGGIDINYCTTKGICHIPAPSLPGKVAPKTAAAAIYYGLELILRHQGEII